jgi:hypothetical protein
MNLTECTSASTSVAPIAEASSVPTLERISADQFARAVASSDGLSLVILDCRPENSFPVIRNAQPIRLPTVLLRRLNNGTLLPSSLSPLLSSPTGQRVVVIPDSMASNSVALRVCDNLLNRNCHVALLTDEISEVARNFPSLVKETEASESVGVGLNLGVLSVCNRISEERSDRFDHRQARASANFPVHILPHLYLGNDETAKNRSVLNGCGIRYIINVTPNLPNYFADDAYFHYLRIPVDDSSSHNLAQYFGDAIAFIEKARSERSSVLVHCFAGISRSVTVCLAYVMYATHSTLEEAFDLLLKQNGAIAPNFHFMETLTCWEKHLFELSDSAPSSSVPSTASSAPSSTCSSA